MIPNASNSPFSAHQDVLDAPIPEESAQRSALLDELKRRGKGAVVGQQWPDAVMLYNKALFAADTNDSKAILKSNIALSQGKMGKWKESLEAAQAAVELDEAYVKGWWRLGQAYASLDDPVAAVRALERALQLEPANKALQKELEKMRAVKPKEVAGDTKPTATGTASTTAKPKKTKPLAKAESTSQSSPMEVDEDDTTDKFTKSDHVRGYKIVNGKKTSFFHNELSEEAAKLIGDIAPKKLEQTTAEPTIQEEGVSVWNKAGTWEEKDCTEWAKESLSAILNATQGGDWKVTKAAIGSGDASVARVRGKKRYIFGMENVVLEWQFRDEEATGKIRVSDFDGTDDEYEFMEFSVSSCDDDSLRLKLSSPTFQKPLRDAIQSQIKVWVQTFNATY